MTATQLIKAAQKQLGNNAEPLRQYGFGSIFQHGAGWMCNRMNELEGCEKYTMGHAINYNFWGWLKYVVCIIVFVVSAIVFYHVNAFLMPLSIVLFYLCEVHFLFLFPLLVQGAKAPLKASIKMTYRTGIFKALFTVMPIAGFMLIGLLKWRAPLKNWYIGSLAILIWFKYETTTGL